MDSVFAVEEFSIISTQNVWIFWTFCGAVMQHTYTDGKNRNRF